MTTQRQPESEAEYARAAEDPIEFDEQLLLRSGYFPWGKDAWIHRSDEGTVLSQEEALARVRK